MAIYHLTAKVISRGKGQSAIASAAYRSGERLKDHAADEVKEYRARAERIQFTGIFAPKDAPDWARDREALWNAVEERESRGQGVKPEKAQLAREIEIALPHELTDEQRLWLVKDFVREQFVRRGLVADVAIHAPDKDSDKRNHHAHILTTMRTVGADGFAPTKDRSLNSPEQLKEWREEWAKLANRHLERHGHEARIDHRNLKEQGIEREPTIHIGTAAQALTERGEKVESRAQTAGNAFSHESRVVDYPNIDQGKSRAEHNAEIVARNEQRERRKLEEKQRAAQAEERAGMVAQQREAMELLRQREQEKARQEAMPRPAVPQEREREQPRQPTMRERMEAAQRRLEEQQRQEIERERIQPPAERRETAPPPPSPEQIHRARQEQERQATQARLAREQEERARQERERLVREQQQRERAEQERQATQARLAREQEERARQERERLVREQQQKPESQSPTPASREDERERRLAEFLEARYSGRSSREDERLRRENDDRQQQRSEARRGTMENTDRKQRQDGREATREKTDREADFEEFMKSRSEGRGGGRQL